MANAKKQSRPRPKPLSVLLPQQTPSKSNSGTSYNLIRLLLTELDLDEHSKQSDMEQDQLESRLITTEESFEQIMNMVRLPIALENLMMFGCLACLNSFMKMLVILPLRVMLDVVMLFKVTREQFTNGKRKRKIRPVINYKVNPSNIIFASLVFLTIGLSSVDTSKIYHKIRNQSSIKLYVMFGVLEISDKLLATVGQDILNVLFATRISSLVQKPKKFLKFVFFYSLSIGYLSLHTIVLIYQTISLTVAANSYSNSLVTLLLSNQFAEIKSSVFKKIDKEGLFQMSCSDIVERFQLLAMLTIISLRNLVQINNSHGVENFGILPNSSFTYLNNLLGVILGPTMIVIGSEILVDWVKHSYVTKFNKIRPKVYWKFLTLLSNDVINNFKNMKFITSNTNYNDKLQQRLGLSLPALYVLFLVMSKDCFKWLLFDHDNNLVPLNLLILLLIFIIALMFKLILELGLLKWSNKIMKHKPTDNIYVPGIVTVGMGTMDKESRKNLYDEDEQVPLDIAEQRKRKHQRGNLSEVMRYRMASKQIW